MLTCRSVADIIRRMARNTSSRALAAARTTSTLERWLTAQASPNTRAAYRADFTLFGTWCAGRSAVPLTADTELLAAFQAARGALGDSSLTVRRRMSALSSFYEFAVEHDVVAVNPVVGVERPKVATDDPSPTAQLSTATVAAYRAAAALIDPRLEALVGLLVCDGLKVAEALALDIDDVSGRAPATAIIVWRRGEPQRVVLDLVSARAVRRCIGERSDGAVFVSERSAQAGNPTRLTRFGADHLIRQLRTDATTEPVTANALRRFHLETR